MPGTDIAVFTYTSHGTTWTLTDSDGDVLEEGTDSEGIWNRAVQLASGSRPSRIKLIDDNGEWVGDTEFALEVNPGS